MPTCRARSSVLSFSLIIQLNRDGKLSSWRCSGDRAPAHQANAVTPLGTPKSLEEEVDADVGVHAGIAPQGNRRDLDETDLVARHLHQPSEPIGTTFMTVCVDCAVKPREVGFRSRPLHPQATGLIARVTLVSTKRPLNRRLRLQQNRLLIEKSNLTQPFRLRLHLPSVVSATMFCWFRN